MRRIDYQSHSKFQAMNLHNSIMAKTGRILEILDSLRANESLKNMNIVFPQIIVVGSESSGKSSVLERIAMFEFFPRGEDICTRMPILFELKRKSNEEVKEYCNSHNLSYQENHWYCSASIINPNSHQTTLLGSGLTQEKIRDNMKSAMDEQVRNCNGAVRGITEVVLTIQVIGNDLPNLRLLDLPGVLGARRPDEPTDMVERTRNLTLKYMKQEHTLILAIVPCYERISNSLIFGLVQQLHKEDMTLGVLTMADKANSSGQDQFYDLKQKLDGKAGDCIYLPHGYHAVRNRDLVYHGGISSLNDAAKAENEFFEQLPSIYHDRCGGNKLIEKITKMFCKYTKDTWAPGVREIVRSNVKRYAEKLAQLGQVPMNDQPFLDSVRDHIQSLLSAPDSFLSAIQPVRNGVLTQIFSSLSSPQLSPLQFGVTYSVAGKYYFVSLSDASKWKAEKTRVDTLANQVAAYLNNGQVLSQALAQLIEKDNTNPLKLFRFPKLYVRVSTLLTELIFSQSIERMLSNWQSQVTTIKVLLDSQPSTRKELQSRVECLFGTLFDEMLLDSMESIRKHVVSFSFRPFHEIFEEKEEIRKEREVLESEISNLNKLLTELETLS